jgi:hypothetical protein
MAFIADMDPLERRADDDADLNAPDSDDADNTNDADDTDDEPPKKPVAKTTTTTTSTPAGQAGQNKPPKTITTTTSNPAGQAGQNKPPKTTTITDAMNNKPPKTTTITDAMNNKPNAAGKAADPTITAPAWLSELMGAQTSTYTWGKGRTSDVLYAQSAYSTILAENPQLAAANMTGMEFNAVAQSLNSSQRGCYADRAFPMALDDHDSCNLGFFCTSYL